MAGKFKNRNLIIIFVVLAGLFLVTRVFKTRKYERTLKTDLVQIDTAGIDQILLYPRSENQEEIMFLKKGDLWTVTKSDVTAEAEIFNIRNIFTDVINMKAEQLIARDIEKWPEFHVDDSLGTRVIMKEGKKTRLDIMIGRFNYQPAPGGGGGYGQNQGRGLTYVRLTNEDEVYMVEGFLSMSFNQPFNNWRDQTIIQADRSRITRVSYDYPMDSGFVLVLLDSLWMIDGMAPDSARTASLLDALSRKSSSTFTDDFSPISAPDFQLRIEGNNMQAVSVLAYRRSGDQYIINSSLNPESYFISPSDGVFKDIFVPKAELLGY